MSKTDPLAVLRKIVVGERFDIRDEAAESLVVITALVDSAREYRKADIASIGDRGMSAILRMRAATVALDTALAAFPETQP